MEAKNYAWNCRPPRYKLLKNAKFSLDSQWTVAGLALENRRSKPLPKQNHLWSGNVKWSWIWLEHYTHELSMYKKHPYSLYQKLELEHFRFTCVCVTLVVIHVIFYIYQVEKSASLVGWIYDSCWKKTFLLKLYHTWWT